MTQTIQAPLEFLLRLNTSNEDNSDSALARMSFIYLVSLVSSITMT